MMHLKDETKPRGIRCNRWSRSPTWKTEDATEVTCKTCKGERATNRFPAKARELSVGDILYTHWGYDQTNINFYQVTKLVGKESVELREISSKVDHAEVGADYVVAVKDSFIQPRNESDKEHLPFVRRADGTSVRNTPYLGYASLWDGKPKYETATGYGH